MAQTGGGVKFSLADPQWGPIAVIDRASGLGRTWALAPFVDFGRLPRGGPGGDRRRRADRSRRTLLTHPMEPGGSPLSRSRSVTASGWSAAASSALASRSAANRRRRRIGCGPRPAAHCSALGTPARVARRLTSEPDRPDERPPDQRQADFSARSGSRTGGTDTTPDLR